MSEIIPFISEEILEEFATVPKGYFWSMDFNPEFYITLAKKGLISTSSEYEGYGDILLPEMQEAYAVLFFNKLHVGKKVRRLMNSSSKVIINQDIETFIPLLQNYHGSESWFTHSYIKLIYKLLPYTLEENNFRINTVFLLYNDIITAGEIGYFIGNTYTSLTGFCRREYLNHGKLQMVLLAGELERMGLSFWNLGHPYMDYKLCLGAEVLSVDEFLPLWNRAKKKAGNTCQKKKKN